MAPKYDVFLSHAGEDKAPLAALIYEGLIRRGISTFFDERELVVGGDAVKDMDEAMQTALVGLFILSPEFALKMYPMLEVECFLRRAGLLGGGSVERGADCPELIPVFYRLPVAGCKYEEVFERMECDEALRERFNERVKRNETSMEKVLEQLGMLAGRTGVENKTGIGNDETEEMKKRREDLAEKICDEVTGVLVRRGRKPEVSHEVRSEKSRRVEEESEAGVCTRFDVPKNPREVVLDFFSSTEDGRPGTYEAEVLREVLRNEEGCKIVSLFGEGGVGKSCILREVAKRSDVRERFAGGVYFISLGMDGSEESFRMELLRILRNSGEKQKASELRDEKSIELVLGEVGKLVGRGRSVVMLDDVWERNGIKGKIVSDVSSVLSKEHGGMVVLTTRSADVASRGDVTVHVKAREAVSEITKKMILKYASCSDEEVEKEGAWWAVEKLQRMSGGLPVCLAVIGRGLRRLRVLVKSKAWEMYWEKMKGGGETLLVEEVDDYKGLETSLSVALWMLEEKQKTAGIRFVYSFREMYGSLCVMKKQRIIPACVVERMWKLRKGGDVLMVMEAFAGVGLGEILYEDEERKGLRVHDLLHDFAMSLIRSEEESVEWHRRLLEGYICLGGEGVREWWTLEDDGYIHENLSRHLRESGAIEELIYLLLRPEWTNNRLERGGLLAWNEDFMHCVEGMERDGASGNMEETRKGLCLVRDAVSACWEIINVNEREQLGFQVYGRLQEGKEWPVRTFLRCVRAWQRGLWLKPDGECWPRPGEGRSEEMAFGDDLPLSISLYGKPIHAVVGTYRGDVMVVNVEEHRIVRRWDGHEEAVTQVAVSNDGGHILSYSVDGTVKRWDVESGAEVGVISLNDVGWFGFEFGRDIGNVAFSRDLSVLVRGSEDGLVHAWDVETGEKVGDAMGGFECAVRCVDISPDGNGVVGGGEDGSVRMWNVSSGEQVWEVPDGHEEEVRCISLSPDGRLIASGSEDETIRLWDARTGEQIGKRLVGHERSVSCVTFSSDGRRIVSGGRDWTVRMWDLETGEQVGGPLRFHDTRVFVVAVSGDGRFAISGGLFSLRIWSLLDTTAKRNDCSTSDAGVTCVAASLDKKFYVSSHISSLPPFSTVLRIWDAGSGKQIGDPIDVKSLVWCVAISPDCRNFVCGMGDGTLQVWDVASRSHVGKELCGHTDEVNAVAYSPNGRWIVSGSDDKTVRLWNVGAHVDAGSAGPVRRTWMKRWGRSKRRESANKVGAGTKKVYEHNDEVWSVAFNADGSRVICGLGNGYLCVWETSTGKLVGAADSEYGSAVGRIDVLKQGHVRSLSFVGEERRWRLESGGGLTRISEVHDGALSERHEGEGWTALPGDDEIVCDGRRVRVGMRGPILATLPAILRPTSWHYDSSRGVVVTGLLDGQMWFCRFVR